MPPSRRRATSLLTGMRLGDMAAALDGRQVQRGMDRDRADQEARRFSAANQALSSIIGGVGDYQDRQAGQTRQASQDARQATLDEERRAAAAAAEKRASDEATRRQAGFEANQLQDTLALNRPGLTAQAGAAFEPAGPEDDVLGMPLGENETPAEAVRADLAASLAALGLDEGTAGTMADGFIADARNARTEAERKAAQDKIDALTAEGKQGLVAAQTGRVDEQTRTEQERQRKLRADTAKAARAGRGRPAGRPSRPGAPSVAGEGERDPRKVPQATTTANLSSKQDAINKLRDLRSFHAKKIKGKGFGTGQVAGPAKDIASKIFDMPDWKTFRTKNDAIAQTVGKALEGGKLAEGDIARYKAMLMDSNLDDNTYAALLDEIEEQLFGTLENEVKNIGQHYDVSAFESWLGENRRGGSPAPEGTPADVVMMIDPGDGKAKPIPRSRMEEAMKRGAVLAEGGQ